MGNLGMNGLIQALTMVATNMDRNSAETIRCLKAISSQRTGNDLKLIGVHLFSGDKTNDYLPSTDRMRIEPNVALFAEKITVALRNPLYKEVDKCRQLLLHVRGSAQELLLGYPQTGQPPFTFDHLLGILCWIFQPIELPCDLLHAIQSAKQKPTEGFDAFHIRLKRMGDRLCKMDASFAPSMDTIIYGTLTRDLPPELRGALELNVDRRDLHRVCNYSKKWLALNPDKMESHKKRLGVSVNYMETMEGEEPVQTIAAVRADATDQRCFRCSKIGHRSAECTNPADIKCFKCNQGGHRAAECQLSSGMSTTIVKTEKGAPTLKSVQKDTNAVKCIICRREGHIMRTCFQHKRSCNIIKNRLLKNNKSVPVEVFSILSDPQQVKEMTEIIKEEGVFGEVEDTDGAITSSIQAFDWEGGTDGKGEKED